MTKKAFNIQDAEIKIKKLQAELEKLEDRYCDLYKIAEWTKEERAEVVKNMKRSCTIVETIANLKGRMKKAKRA